jgi:cytochrome c oxidase subunit 2
VDGALAYLTTTTGICFAAMATILLIAVVFHRGRKREAAYGHGNRLPNHLLAFAVAAAVFFGIDAVALVRSADRLRTGFWSFPDDQPNVFRVEVLAQQWSWTFRVPGPDGLFNTADDLVTLNELRVPIDRPVYLQMRSKDVIHSLYLPNFRTKMDVVPGMTTRLWFQPREAGTFEIGCAQHCGVSHYKMRGELTVLEPAEYERWAARASEDARLRFDAADVEAHDGWPWTPRS